MQTNKYTDIHTHTSIFLPVSLPTTPYSPPHSLPSFCFHTLVPPTELKTKLPK